MTSKMQAVFVGKNDLREIRQYDVPTPGAGEILVKNVAVSSNPKDWKMATWLGREDVEGNDIAGHVVEVGQGVTKFKKGDKVAAFTKMVTDAKYGAYAEYSVAPTISSFHLGPKTSFEDAAALPLAYATAVLGLFLRLQVPEQSTPSTSDDVLVVYGAATTVGVYVVQLAKRAGLRVVGVAGSSADLAKSYGVDTIVDYRGGKSPEAISDEIVAATKGSQLRYVFDAVSEHGSFEASVLALSKASPGQGTYTHVLPLSDEQKTSAPAGVTIAHTTCDAAYQGGSESDFVERYFDRLGPWIEAGEFRSQRVEVIPGGLEGVKVGLRRLEDGKVNGAKLVYRIAETPSLSA